MNNLKKRFLSFREEFPALGDVIIISMAVEGMEYPKRLIQRAFNELVSKDEFAEDEKREIIDGLINYSNK